MGTRQNSRKSLRSFKRAFELGYLEAGYCVGYYYLKGFGDVPQDYVKAYRWFEKSESPMGRHWMAKMNFFGLGREINKNKALRILRENTALYNSEVLLAQFENQNPPNNKTNNFENLCAERTISDLWNLSGLNNIPNKHAIEGKWSGEFLELDWSGTKILRSLPIEVEFSEVQSTNESIRVSLVLNDSIASEIAHFSSGKLSIPRLNFPLKKQFTDYPNFTHLITEINEIKFRSLQFNNENLLVGKVKAKYPLWHEKSKPIVLLLKKKIYIDQQARVAFEKQGGDFIKIYPNPYIDKCLVNFEIPVDSDVKVTITNYYNTSGYYNELFNGRKQKGEHTFEFYDLPSHSGSYLLKLIHNGKEETKIIIKQ